MATAQAAQQAARQNMRNGAMAAIIASATRPNEVPSTEIIRADPIDDAGDHVGVTEYRVVWSRLPEGRVMLEVCVGSDRLHSGIGDNADDALSDAIEHLLPPEETI